MQQEAARRSGDGKDLDSQGAEYWARTAPPRWWRATSTVGLLLVPPKCRRSTAVFLCICLPPLMRYALLLLLVLPAHVHGVSLRPATTPSQEQTPQSLMAVPPSPSSVPDVLPQGESDRVGETLAAALIQALRRAMQSTREQLCPYPYKQVIHECFYLNKKKLTWPQARRVCQGMGGDLAEPRHIYALQTYLADTYGPSYVWVGATSEGSDGEWRWLSGRPLDPEDWLFTRPDNQGGDEHCLEMVMSDYPKVFNDETCSLAQRFICQYRQE